MSRLDERARRRAARGLTAISAAVALIVVLLVAQIWLLSASLESYLAGHREVALPGAIASGLLLGGCVALYAFIVRVDRERGE